MPSSATDQAFDPELQAELDADAKHVATIDKAAVFAPVREALNWLNPQGMQPGVPQGPVVPPDLATSVVESVAKIPTKDVLLGSWDWLRNQAELSVDIGSALADAQYLQFGSMVAAADKATKPEGAPPTTAEKTISAYTTEKSAESTPESTHARDWLARQGVDVAPNLADVTSVDLKDLAPELVDKLDAVRARMGKGDNEFDRMAQVMLQWAIPYAATMKVFGGVSQAPGAAAWISNMATRETAAGIAAYVAFDPHEGRFADFVKALGPYDNQLLNKYVDLLASDPADNDAIGRWKTAVDFATVGLPFVFGEVAFLGGRSLVRGAMEHGFPVHAPGGPAMQRGAVGVESAAEPAVSEQPFYSALGKAVDSAPIEKGTPEQWLGTLRNTPGVKPEELDWYDLEGAFKDAKSVTRQEITDYLRANELQVKEVVLSSSSPYNFSGNEWQTAITRAEHEGNFAEAERIQRAWEGLDEETGSTVGQPKFSQWQLPGGKNYRELLLTLPPAESAKSSVEGLTPREQFDFAPRTGADLFRGGHYDQPNVVAHVRFNERTGANGEKVLFIEEIQSDWHQKGRKQGYGVTQSSMTESDRARFLELTGRGLGGDTGLTAGERTEFQELTRRYLNSTPSSGVPDAPFKKTWPELAFKRMVRWAAENGFDSVAWTTGEQQAARYDLSKAVNRIEYQKNGRLVAWDLEGTKVIDQTVAEDQLPNTIGKEAAERLLNAPKESFGERSIEGENLKVGGEGQKGFYDKMIPAIASKLGKKYGAKVIDTDIQQLPFEDAAPEVWKDSKVTVKSLQLTPALKKAALAGQPLFATAPIGLGLEGAKKLTEKQEQD